MGPYNAAAYGDGCADFYDQIYAPARPHELVRLKELAGGGRALELGIGTGRVALPLAQSGVAVAGIEASGAMIDRLRAKPGGAALAVARGDFADVEVAGDFALIYALVNTFFLLPSHALQARCLRNVARRLAAGGAFLLEVFIPPWGGPVNGRVAPARLACDDNEPPAPARARHRLSLRQRIPTAGGPRLYAVEMHVLWPAEMDEMAAGAGLRLRQRMGGWRGEPCTAQSGHHIVVYEHACQPITTADGGAGTQAGHPSKLRVDR